MDEDKKSADNPFSDLNLNPSTPSLVVKLEILETVEEMEKLPNFVSQAGKQRKKGVFKMPYSLGKDRGGDDAGGVVKSLKKRSLFKDESLHLECEWNNCGETAGRMEDFMRHVATHVAETEVRQNPAPLLDVFACLWADCGFECSSSEVMIRHVHFHSFHAKVKCHGANMLAENGLEPCKLEPSQRNILPDLAQPFLCEWEGCEFWNERWEMPQNFYWHVKNHAEELRGSEMKCRWRGCTKVDTAVSKIKEHMRSHSQEKMIGCPNCGGMFANRVKFYDHCIRQQGGQKSFTCTTCNKGFTIERHLRDHMRAHIHHHKCPQCDMTCTSPSTLANHIRYRHTEEKPFTCEFCHYKGKTMADIKSHLRIHYNEVTMSCPEENCKFTCRSKMTLKQHHLSVHSENSLLYSCHLCDVRFDRGAYLTKHLTNTHSFSWPSGHSRFRYIKDLTTGLYQLQTVRLDSLQVHTGPPSVESESSDWDMFSCSGPLSVQSCPELGSHDRS